MVIKEKNKLKPTYHKVYYCDYCCKKIVQQRGEYMYILRRNAKEKTKHFCCYQCRSDYLKSEKNERANFICPRCLGASKDLKDGIIGNIYENKELLENE